MGEKSALGTGGRQSRSESIKVQCSERGLKRKDWIPNRKPIMRVPKRFFGARDFETGSLEFKALKMGVRFGIKSLKGLLGTLYYTTVNQKAIPQFYCSWRTTWKQKCTEHNLTKEVIFYKMIRVLSSQHLMWSKSLTYCSTVHHSWFKSNSDVAKFPESREKTGPQERIECNDCPKQIQILTYIRRTSESHQINANLHLHSVVISRMFRPHSSKNSLRLTTDRDLHPIFFVKEFYVSQDELWTFS